MALKALSKVGSFVDDMALKPIHITSGRFSEQAAIFPVKLADALIADADGGSCRIYPFGHQNTARFVQSQVLLILDRAHRGRLGEVAV
jgi:hypothetical protein